MGSASPTNTSSRVAPAPASQPDQRPNGFSSESTLTIARAPDSFISGGSARRPLDTHLVGGSRARQRKTSNETPCSVAPDSDHFATCLLRSHRHLLRVTYFSQQHEMRQKDRDYSLLSSYGTPSRWSTASRSSILVRATDNANNLCARLAPT